MGIPKHSDRRVDATDALTVLSWLFRVGPEPRCLDTAAVNDDEAIEIGDSLYLLHHLFLDGLPIPAPGPVNCGFSTTASISCDAFPPCADG